MAASQHDFPELEVTRRATAPENLQNPCHDLLNRVRFSPDMMKGTALMDLSDGETQAFRHLAHSIVSRTLAHQKAYQLMNCPELSRGDWKLLKRRNDLSVYKRRLSTHNDQTRGLTESNRRMLLCVGTMHGSLEDVLYGIHAKTREEMQLTVPHVSKGYLDCTMLAKLEGGSPLDPYRQLSLKWHLTEAIGDAKLSHLRDLCVLEFMGISTDSQGERYAYHLIKSVEFGGCPAPPEGCGVIRANIMFCSIYRQAPGSSVVRVYAKGMFDLGGDTPSFLTNNTSCSLMLTIPRAVESSEAKRLTLLAVRKAASSVSSSCEDLPTDDDLDEFDLSVDSVDLSADEMSSGYSNSAHSISAEVVSVSAPPTLFRLLSKGKSKKRQQAGGVCCVCAKQPAMAAIVVTSHRSCGVCHRGVCSKCRVKRQLYARSQPVPVTCCKSCLVEAKQLAVDPQNPCPMLL